MSLSQGTLLGPYRIEAPIGAGGMGAVYRAHDTRLDRTVAIKVLSPELAGDAQLRARFEREAKTISSLNHPNICTLFDVGQTRVDSASGGEDVHYLVMEHIEGETLADRLEKGPLPIDEVIRRGSEIADALDRAHRLGIVHRDIKPGNIMLTRSGAKLLDFGLSRYQDDALQAPNEDLTAHKPLTEAGTILGTWLYMAPEQLDGAVADARTDIFAFGCVLYEMTTGRRAFEGKSRSSLIAAIVSSQPRPLSEFQPLAPPALEQIIRKCLEKDPEERWQSVRDLRSALQWLGDAGSQAGVPKAIIGARKRSKRLLEALAIAGWIVAAAAAVWMLTHRGDEAKLLRTEVVIPRNIGIDAVIQGAAVLSPEGDRVVFRSGRGEYPLAIRELVGGDTRLIDGTNGAEFPFWSPDGRWLGFFADSKLKKVEARGGPVQVLCDAPAGRGGAWSTTGWIVLAPDIDGPLMKVNENGGTPEAVTVAAGKTTHRNPFFLADGRRFLFTARDPASDAAARVMLGQIDDRTSREIVANGSNPQAAGGYLLFSRDGNLIAQRFDDAKVTVAGPLVPIAEAIDYYNPRDLANYSVNASGTLLYRKMSRPPSELVWFGRDGRELERVSEPAQVTDARLARDGRTVVLVRSEVRGNARDIWLHEVDRRQSTRSTFTSSAEINAVVSPDGEKLAVFSYAGTGMKSSNQLWIQPVGGAAGAEPTLVGDRSNWTRLDWSPDGRYLVGTTQTAGTGYDISWIALDAPGKINRFLSSRFDESAMTLSPDGRWLTWTSNASGRIEAYVGEFPTGKSTSQISQGGVEVQIDTEGSGPTWNSDGRELVFRATGGAWVSVRATASDGSIRLDAPVKLPLPTVGTKLVGVDGDRFLLLREIPTDEQPLRLVQNWTRSLER